MKKEYSKPFLVLESFQLDAAIAASCSDEGIPLNHFIGSCFENTGDGYLFDNKCGVDLTAPGTGDVNDRMCYHGPELSEGKTFIYS